MIELEDEKLDVKITGEVYSIRIPNLGEWEKFSKELVSSDEGEIPVMKKFFTKMGMPKKVVMKLQMAHMAKLLKAMSDVKKN